MQMCNKAVKTKVYLFMYFFFFFIKALLLFNSVQSQYVARGGGPQSHGLGGPSCGRTWNSSQKEDTYLSLKLLILFIGGTISKIPFLFV